MAWHSMARHRMAQHGVARHGVASPGPCPALCLCFPVPGVPCCAMPCHAVPRTPCHAEPCHAKLGNATLCHAVQCATAATTLFPRPPASGGRAEVPVWGPVQRQRGVPSPPNAPGATGWEKAAPQGLNAGPTDSPMGGGGAVTDRGRAVLGGRPMGSGGAVTDRGRAGSRGRPIRTGGAVRAANGRRRWPELTRAPPPRPLPPPPRAPTAARAAPTPPPVPGAGGGRAAGDPLPPGGGTHGSSGTPPSAVTGTPGLSRGAQCGGGCRCRRPPVAAGGAVLVCVCPGHPPPRAGVLQGVAPPRPFFTPHPASRWVGGGGEASPAHPPALTHRLGGAPASPPHREQPSASSPCQHLSPPGPVLAGKVGVSENRRSRRVRAKFAAFRSIPPAGRSPRLHKGPRPAPQRVGGGAGLAGDGRDLFGGKSRANWGWLPSGSANKQRPREKQLAGAGPGGAMDPRRGAHPAHLRPT